jgi:CubicO group peptidase (beta-lactamase class C family)
VRCNDIDTIVKLLSPSPAAQAPPRAAEAPQARAPLRVDAVRRPTLQGRGDEPKVTTGDRAGRMAGQSFPGATGDDSDRDEVPTKDWTKDDPPMTTGLPSDGSASVACRTLQGEYASSCASGTRVIGESVLSALTTIELDLLVATFLEEREIPNAAVAVVAEDGRLVYIRGFTNCAAYEAAHETPYYAGPHSKFRIASVSKVLTAMGVLKAEELGLLDTGDLVGDYVDLTTGPDPLRGDPDGVVEERLASVEIRHCLTHTGGWIRPQGDRGGFLSGVFPPLEWGAWIRGMVAGEYAYADPQNEPSECAAANRATWPISPVHMLRYGNTAKISFWPGTTFCYSNYGYWLLGWVVDGASCRSYESFVDHFVLKPVGASNTEMGDAELRLRKVGEVPYFTEAWAWQEVDLVYPATESRHSRDGGDHYDTDDSPMGYTPYLGRDIRLHRSGGGWVSTAYDLARVMRDVFAVPSSVLGGSTVDNGLLPHCVEDSDPAAHTTADFDHETLGAPTLLGFFRDSCDPDKRTVTFDKAGHHPGSHALVRHYRRSAKPSFSVVYLFNRYYEEGDDWEPPSEEFQRLREAYTDFQRDVFEAALSGLPADDWGAGRECTPEPP